MAEKHPVELNLLAETFNINNQPSCSHLDEWLSFTVPLSDFEQQLFDEIYEKARKKAQYWNEEELKMHLISPLMWLARIDERHKIEIFYERPLHATILNYSLSVICDCMIATPMKFNKPKKPYFFLQEYKRGRGDDKDPEAQTLAAMLIAQHHNNDGKPLYGSYVIGSNWWFTTLIGEDYCSSREFNMENRQDLLQIVFILKRLKTLILDR